jgi:hypothetical protein
MACSTSRSEAFNQPPQALIALVAEVGVLLVLGGWLVAEHAVRRAVRTVPHAPV